MSVRVAASVHRDGLRRARDWFSLDIEELGTRPAALRDIHCCGSRIRLEPFERPRSG